MRSHLSPFILDLGFAGDGVAPLDPDDEDAHVHVDDRFGVGMAVVYFGDSPSVSVRFTASDLHAAIDRAQACLRRLADDFDQFRSDESSEP